MPKRSQAALFRGRTIQRGFNKVTRFSPFERFCHWLTATCFIVPAISRLNITFGKLLPAIGPEPFSAFAQAAKYTHNFSPSPLMLGVLLIASLWFKDNIPRKVETRSASALR